MSKEEALASRGVWAQVLEKFSLSPDNPPKMLHVHTSELNEEGGLTCPRCGGNHSVKVNLGGVDAVLECLCSCDLEERKRADYEQRKRSRLDKIERLRCGALPASTYASYTLESDDGKDAEHTQLSKAYITNFQQAKSEGCGLYFAGLPGTGKTYFAAAIVNALTDKAYTTKISSVPELLAQMGDAEGYKNAIELAKTVDLLVLDDLGAENPNTWNQERLFMLINTRYTLKLPLIVTSNIRLEKLLEDSRYTRIADRLMEMCVSVICKVTRRQDLAKHKAQLLRGFMS